VIRTLWAAALVVGVAGCATTLPSVTDPAAWTTGRLSLQVQASPDRPSQSLSAAFELRGGATTGELRMLSPLGTLLVAASWNDKMATLSTPEGQRRFDNLDQLSQEALGETLPLAALPDWLAGKPWPQAAHQLQAEGFEQLGWQITTNRIGEGWIMASRERPPRVNLRFKLDRADPP
jgi:outer membrane lipoprotein LolB